MRISWIVVLQVITGLVVTFVRHDLDKQRVPLDTWFNLLISWVVHTIGIMVLAGLASIAIMRFHKFFVGYEYKAQKDWLEELPYAVVMTILVATIAIFFVAHYVPLEDD